MVTLGALQIVGPARQQRYTCVSGQTCALNDIAGHGLQEGDVFAVLDTCGAGRGARGSFAGTGFPSGMHADG